MKKSAIQWLMLGLLFFNVRGYALDSLRVLWLGNSLSNYADMARASEMDSICAQKGLACRNVYGSYMFDESYGWYMDTANPALEKPMNKDLIRKGKWDYVVIQVFGGSGTHLVSSHYEDFTMDQMKQTIRLWDDLIRKAGAKTLLYHPWGTDGPKPNWDAVAKVWKPDRMDSVVTHLKEIAKELGVWIMPVGAAQWTLLKNYPKVPLWIDWIHGTKQVGYLGGLVCYSAMTGGDPRTVRTLYGLTADEGILLRNVAYETVTRSEFVPYVHPFGVTSIHDRLNKNSLGKLQISSYPNPFQSGVTLEFSTHQSQSVQLTITNMSGHAVRQFKVNTNVTGPNSIFWNGRDDSGVPVTPGVYSVVFQEGTAKTVTKLFKLE